MSVDWPDDDPKEEPEEFIQDPNNPYVKYPKNRVETPKQDVTLTGEPLIAKTWPEVGLSKVLKSLDVENLVDAVSSQRINFKK